MNQDSNFKQSSLKFDSKKSPQYLNSPDVANYFADRLTQLKEKIKRINERTVQT